MKTTRIDIVVDEARLAENEAARDLCARNRRFEPVERVPVAINTNQWSLLAARGRTAADYLRSPVDNLREQILNMQYRIENIPDDAPIPTERIGVGVDFGCLRGTEFEMEILWPEDQPPKAVHPITEPEQIDDLAVPDPAGGLHARQIEWMHAMRERIGDFDVRLNGTPLELEVGLGYGGGPMPSAFALCGQNLFLWMLTDPDRVHRLMEIVTESHLRCHRFFDELMGRDPNHPIGQGADTIEMLSDAMFREFVAPHYVRIYEAFPGPRGFHNCGKNEHLLDTIRDVLRIDSHNGFGFCVDPAVLAEKMGGRVFLSGGPNPVLLVNQGEEEIRAVCRRYIDTLAPYGGFQLGLGGGAVPGTPVESYRVMIDEARRTPVPAPA